MVLKEFLQHDYINHVASQHDRIIGLLKVSQDTWNKWSILRLKKKKILFMSYLGRKLECFKHYTNLVFNITAKKSLDSLPSFEHLQWNKSKGGSIEQMAGPPRLAAPDEDKRRFYSQSEYSFKTEIVYCYYTIILYCYINYYCNFFQSKHCTQRSDGVFIFTHILDHAGIMGGI